VEKKNLKLPEGWQFETFEVLPGLFLPPCAPRSVPLAVCSERSGRATWT